MPEYTATEIDEPDDWIILENLMRKYVLNKQNKDFANVKLFLTDIDGTLTDGGMYYSEMVMNLRNLTHVMVWDLNYFKRKV